MGVPEKLAIEVQKPRRAIGVRHVQALMLFLGMVIAFTMRVNLSLAIVDMTDKTKNGSFDWSEDKKSYVLSSYFWGYVVLQMPSGAFAVRFGGKALIVALVGANSLVSLLLPLSAYKGGWLAVCACRVVQGLAQGLLYASIHTLISKWVPVHEKGRLGTFIYSGGQFGTAIQLITSGFFAEYWGWPSLFYINGTLGAIWTAVYVFIGSESPQTSRIISQEERFYIEDSLGDTSDNRKLITPWKSILTSLPVWALVIAHSGQNWGFWTLLTEIPSYMNKALGAGIKTNGVYSALPYIAMYVLSFPCGYLSDLVIRKKWLSVTATRKLSNSIGHYGPALALIALTFAPKGDVHTAVALLTLVVGLNAGQYTGYLLVHIDMSPNFAGILMGISNCFANITGILAPIVAGAIVGSDETNPGQWHKVFYLSSAVYVAFNTFFLLFGSSQLQKWNEASLRPGNRTDVVNEKKPEKV